MTDPAHDIDAERAVLGAALYSGGRLLDRLELACEDFHHPVHAELWALMHRLHAAGDPAEPTAVVAASDRKAVHAPAVAAAVAAAARRDGVARV